MTKLVFSNNAVTSLSSNIDAVTTTIPVGTTSAFPTPSIGVNEFYITLRSIGGDIEVCRVTAMSASDFTVVRGEDNTIAQAFTATSTTVSLRATAGVYEKLGQFAQEYTPAEGDIFCVDSEGALVECDFASEAITASSDPQSVFAAAEAVDMRPGAVSVYLNGIYQTQGTHYSVSSNTITFLLQPYPSIGDVVTVHYMKVV